MNVAVRVRPIFQSESGAGQRCVVQVDEMTNAVHITKVARAGAVLRSELGNDYVYQFDKAYGPTVGCKYAHVWYGKSQLWRSSSQKG